MLSIRIQFNVIEKWRREEEETFEDLKKKEDGSSFSNSR